MVGLFHPFLSHLSCRFSFSSRLFYLWPWGWSWSLWWVGEAGNGSVGASFCKTVRWAAGASICPTSWPSFLLLVLLTLSQLLPVLFPLLRAWLAANYCQGVSQSNFKVLSLPGVILFEQVGSGNPRIFKEPIKCITKIVQVSKWDHGQERPTKKPRRAPKWTITSSHFLSEKTRVVRCGTGRCQPRPHCPG